MTRLSDPKGQANANASDLIASVAPYARHRHGLAFRVGNRVLKVSLLAWENGALRRAT